MPAARRRSRLGVLSPALIMRRKALRQGFLGGDRTWQLVGVVIFGRRLLKKALGGVPEIVATERLEPGQSIQISAIPPARSSRRSR